MSYNDLFLGLLYVSMCVTLLVACFFYFKPHLIIPTFANVAMFLAPGGKKHRVVLKNGLMCSYFELGNIESKSETLLYLHGFTESAGNYLSYIPYLLRWKHVVFLTLLNHGDAEHLSRDVEISDMMDYINQFLEHSGLHARKFHLAGYSLGGCVAMHYAAQNPDKIASVLLLNPYGLHVWPKGSETSKMFNHLTDDMYFKRTEDFQQFFDYITSGTLRLPRFVMSIARHHRNEMCSAEGCVLRGVLGKKNLIEKEILEKLGGIPVMCIQGEKDAVTPKDGLGYLTEHVPHTNTHVVTGGSHLMTYTHIKVIANLMKEWVDVGCHGTQSNVRKLE